MSKAAVIFAVIAVAAALIGFFLGGYSAAAGLARVVFLITALFTFIAIVTERGTKA